MRNYFDLKLKGSHIFRYVIIGWAASIALGLFLSIPAIERFRSSTGAASAERLLDAGYLWGVVLAIAVRCVAVIIHLVVLFFVVKATLAGLSLGEERFEPQYDFKSYMWLAIKGMLLSIVTLGIYIPWFAVKLIDYFGANTAFRFNAFKFKGRGVTLFGIIVLTAILPIFLVIVWLAAVGVSSIAELHSLPLLRMLLTIFALLFILAFSRALILKWFFDFSHGPRRITSDMKLLPSTFFIMGQALLVAITLGFYLPMYVLRTYRYFMGHMLLGEERVEERLGFTLSAWNDYFYLLGQGLLTIITLGIYGSWAYAKIATRLLDHSYAETMEEPKAVMPQER